jgi:4-amino-4-deoxy-L-arabinose transferase-like glycosyltransferase
VPIRAPRPRVLLWALLLLCGPVAVAGGLALRGPEVVAIGIAGALAGCLASGITREIPVGSRRRSTLEAAALVGAATVGGLLVIAGIAALAGPAVAFLKVGGVLVAVMGARLLFRARRPVVPPTAKSTTLPRHPSTGPPTRSNSSADVASLLPPVAVMTNSDLGQEWMRTGAILAGRLEAAARESLVARRQEALDELERRDPAGFARWLAAGPTVSSDPAGHVQGGPLRGDPAADTDAA